MSPLEVPSTALTSAGVSGTAEFLFELGCEELPAAFVEKAVRDLAESFTSRLREAFPDKPVPDPQTGATPRRLIVAFTGLPQRQEDSTKEVRGPALAAAFDDAGNPKPPLLGFCRSQGADVSTVEKRDGYAWVTKQINGKATEEILAEIIPAAVLGLSFEKSMRWGTSRTRFARPIRWVLALFNEKTIATEIVGISASNESHGHRFYSPGAFEVNSFASLMEGLRSRFVEPDPERRREGILNQIQSKVGPGAEITGDLLDENVFLTEWPTPVVGEFNSEFLDLPRPVLVTAMAKHERMFPVAGESGALKNQFIFVRNSGDDQSVASGAQWVLNARLQDAQFFFEADRKHDMAFYLEETQKIAFQAKLGSVRQRADRLGRLTNKIAELTGADSFELQVASQAGLYAKADLSTGLVSEMSSLQGIVGGEYGRLEGFPDEVCQAISSQYDLNRITGTSTSAERTALRLILADALDKLAGYLSIGLAPSGSSDPFALRRAATFCIEVAWRWGVGFPDLGELFELAHAGYRSQDLVESGVPTALFSEVISGRYDSLLPNYRYDLRAAAGVEPLFPRRIHVRYRALEALVQNPEFLAASLRPLNLLNGARKSQAEIALNVNERSFTTEVELKLLRTVEETIPLASSALSREEPLELAQALLGITKPINEFFDQTMVMVDDLRLRADRLGLLARTASLLMTAGDFTQIVS